MRGAGPDSWSLARDGSTEMLSQMGEVTSVPGNGAKGAPSAGPAGKRHQNLLRGQ